MRAEGRISRGNAGLIGMAMGMTGFVVVAVNVLIYWARDLYAINHPEFVAKQPATISQALSDTIIGPFFAKWMVICAPVLWVGVCALVWAGWVEFRRSGYGTTRERRTLLWLSVCVVVLQAMAAAGMVMLSQFRFPDHNVLHMQGSYLFFFSQAFVIVFGEFVSRGYARHPKGATFLSDAGARVRRWYVWVPIGLGLLYLALFIIKGFDLGALNDGVYVAYTSVEPLLLSSFLGYVLTFHYDMGLALWGYVRSRSCVANI